MIQRMTTRARTLLLAGVLLLALSGCMKVDADLKVNKNETVSGSMLMAVDKEVAEQFGQSPDAFREQIEKSIKEGAHEGVECKSYDDGTYIGSQCTLDDVKFSDMGGSDSGLKFEKDGDRFVVSGGTGSLPGGTGALSGADKAQIKFKITMPGKILEHDDGAQVDGRSATYTDPLKMGNIRLVSKADSGFPVWLIVLLVLLLLGGGGAVAFFVLKGRRGGGQGAPQWGGQQFPAAGQWGPQPGQPGTGQPVPGQQPGPWGPQQGQPGQQPWGGQPGQQFPGQQGPQASQGQQPWGQPGPQQQGYPGQQPGQGAPRYPGQPGPYRGPQGQPGPGQQPPQQWGGQPGGGRAPQAQPPYGGPQQPQDRPSQPGQPQQPPQGQGQGPRQGRPPQAPPPQGEPPQGQPPQGQPPQQGPGPDQSGDA
jgi:hypothetical protein